MLKQYICMLETNHELMIPPLTFTEMNCIPNYFIRSFFFSAGTLLHETLFKGTHKFQFIFNTNGTTRPFLKYTLTERQHPGLVSKFSSSHHQYFRLQKGGSVLRCILVKSSHYPVPSQYIKKSFDSANGIQPKISNAYKIHIYLIWHINLSCS